MISYSFARRVLGDLDLQEPRAAREQVAVIDGIKRQIESEPAVTPARLTDKNVAGTLDRLAAAAAARQHRVEVARGLIRGVESQYIGAVLDAEDELLDQYRPRFDEAAQLVRAAVEAGIRPSTSDSDAQRRGGEFSVVYGRLRHAADALDAAERLVGLVSRRRPELAGGRIDARSVARWVAVSEIKTRVAVGSLGTSGPWSTLDDVQQRWASPLSLEYVAPTSAASAPAAGWLAALLRHDPRRGAVPDDNVTLRLNSTAEVRALLARADDADHAAA